MKRIYLSVFLLVVLVACSELPSKLAGTQEWNIAQPSFVRGAADKIVRQDEKDWKENKEYPAPIDLNAETTAIDENAHPVVTFVLTFKDGTQKRYHMEGPHAADLGGELLGRAWKVRWDEENK